VGLVAQLEWADLRPGRNAQKWAKVNVEVEVEGLDADGDLEVVLAPEVWSTCKCG